MNIISKLIIVVITGLSFQTFAGILKKSDIIAYMGINHTGFDYVNSEPYFKDRLHIGHSIGIAYKHQLWKSIRYSVGLDYCVLGGKKYFNYSDTLFYYDTTSMAYHFFSKVHIVGSYSFYFKYVSLPVMLTCKIANLPLEAALGSTFGYIINKQRGDHRVGVNGETKATPVNNETEFHSRLNGSIEYNFIKKPLTTSIGFLYSHELTRITSVLTSRGIYNTNEFRIYLSVAVL